MNTYNEEWLTRLEVAEFTQRTLKTVYSWKKKYGIKFNKAGLIKKSELLKKLEED